MGPQRRGGWGGERWDHGGTGSGAVVRGVTTEALGVGGVRGGTMEVVGGDN